MSVLQRVPALVCPRSKVTYHRDTCLCPLPPAESPLKFQNKPRWKHGEAGGAYLTPSLGREGDYEGLWPFLILHSSSLQRLRSASVSCQNKLNKSSSQNVQSCCDHENVIGDTAAFINQSVFHSALCLVCFSYTNCV